MQTLCEKQGEGWGERSGGLPSIVFMLLMKRVDEKLEQGSASYITPQKSVISQMCGWKVKILNFYCYQIQPRDTQILEYHNSKLTWQDFSGKNLFL